MKDRLIHEVRRSREAIWQDLKTVKAELDVAAKIKNAVRRNPLSWLGGAAAIGYVFAGPKRVTRVVKKTEYRDALSQKPIKNKKASHSFGPVGIALGLVKLGFPLLRPIITGYAAKRFAEITAKLAK